MAPLFVCPALRSVAPLIYLSESDGKASCYSTCPFTVRFLYCLVALLSMFSSLPGSLRPAGRFPVCGCKVTTVFSPRQIFLSLSLSRPYHAWVKTLNITEINKC